MPRIIPIRDLKDTAAITPMADRVYTLTLLFLAAIAITPSNSIFYRSW